MILFKIQTWKMLSPESFIFLGILQSEVENHYGKQVFLLDGGSKVKIQLQVEKQSDRNLSKK